MFHIELRTGMQVVRRFNLGDERLWLDVLAPLLADRPLWLEGHEFLPRQSRLKVYEGPELRPDQLGMGRGWQNVERTAADVTERILTRAREHMTASPERPEAIRTVPAAELVRERAIGRLDGGALAAEELLAIAAELMPAATAEARLEAARAAAWELLQRGIAQLTPSGR